MNTILVSSKVFDRYGDVLQQGLGKALKLRYHVWDGRSPIPLAERDRIEVAYLSPDIMGDSSKTRSTPAFESFFAQIREAPRLRWLHLCTAGADRPMFQEFVQQGVIVTTSSGANAQPVAHTALAALLYFGRGLPHWQAAQRTHEWQPVRNERGLPALQGSTVTVVGTGPIGREICRLCREIGMHVIGVRRSAEQIVECDETRTYDELDEILPRTGWLILACPLTETTRHLIDLTRLLKLPSTAYLINLSRGEVAVDDAIRHVLSTGALAGAFLDVFEQEPLPFDSPLWDVPNLVIAAHSASMAPGFARRTAALFADNVGRWIDGMPLRNAVARH